MTSLKRRDCLPLLYYIKHTAQIDGATTVQCSQGESPNAATTYFNESNSKHNTGPRVIKICTKCGKPLIRSTLNLQLCKVNPTVCYTCTGWEYKKRMWSVWMVVRIIPFTVCCFKQSKVGETCCELRGYIINVPHHCCIHLLGGCTYTGNPLATRCHGITSFANSHSINKGFYSIMKYVSVFL